MQVPLLDLQAQYAGLKDEILAAVGEVLDSQRCIGGPKLEALEAAVAEASSARFGIGVSSGTDAILATLMTLEIGAGDEVITTPFTFFATAGCIARVGARPVFVDIDPITFNIDPTGIEAAVTERTRAIMPVHLFGQMAEMGPIMAIAERHDLAVIEDAAQAITATYHGNKAGSLGVAGCFSFFPSKNLGGIGDGGMIVTQDESLANQLKLLRNHGMAQQYRYERIGGNFRLDAIQAAALLVKLGHLDRWSEKRRQNADYYTERLSDCPAITTPVIADHCVSIVNQYTLRVQRRDELFTHLKEQGIGCSIYYPLGLHLQPCFAGLGYTKGSLPVTEKACEEVISLPVYPELTTEMKDHVIEVIRRFYAR